MTQQRPSVERKIFFILFYSIRVALTGIMCFNYNYILFDPNKLQFDFPIILPAKKNSHHSMEMNNVGITHQQSSLCDRLRWRNADVWCQHTARYSVVRFTKRKYKGYLVYSHNVSDSSPCHKIINYHFLVSIVDWKMCSNFARSYHTCILTLAYKID